MASGAATFDSLWADIVDVGRDAGTGGYQRFAWAEADLRMREWFAGACASRGLELSEDRFGNQWGWWGDPDAQPGVVTGSHLDSVPDGGAYDGPLGVISALLAVECLQDEGFRPARPIGLVNFADEEGARFGVACTGSRVITGAMTAERALGLTDADGISMAEAMERAGRRTERVGRDDEALRRIGCFVELHVEQGRGLADLGRPVAVAGTIWPHGRWRLDFTGEANHAGTTRMTDRRDALAACAEVITAAQAAALEHGCHATIGKLTVHPGGVNAIPGAATAWLDARGADADRLRDMIAELSEAVRARSGEVSEESWTDPTCFAQELITRLSRLLDSAPVLGTGAGHDAGILAQAGVPATMIFVRNPTGVSHSPAEHAERDDCLAGVEALTTALRDLAGPE
jgi:beta-ureidopropionase / N-carbamoyl-L-amino-acid hydrolase